MLMLEEDPAVTVVATGGTIDKRYGKGAGVTDLHIGEPYAPARLRVMVGDRVRIHQISLMRKDSTKMNDHDRGDIVRLCLNLPDKAIIITHGTDTMRDTAQALDSAGLGLARVVILTGSLQPAVMRDSDADANLGAALATALVAPPGVYIAMGGVALWNRVVKDPRTGRFVSVKGR